MIVLVPKKYKPRRERSGVRNNQRDENEFSSSFDFESIFVSSSITVVDEVTLSIGVEGHVESWAFVEETSIDLEKILGLFIHMLKCL